MFFYFYIYITAFFFSIFSILAKSNFFTKMWIYFLFFLILIYVGLRDGLGSDWGSYSEMYAYSWKEKNIAIPDIGFNLISHFFYHSKKTILTPLPERTFAVPNSNYPGF